MVTIEKCEDCHQVAEALYHCSCGKWVCGDCGWYNHWQEAAQHRVQWTLLESPRFEVASCQCGLCKGTHTTLPQSH